MDFSLLPEEVLVNVLKMSSPTTVVVAKRLNRKLNRIVERNHLGKPRVDDFSVEMRTFLGRSRPVGKLQLKNTGKMHRRVVVTMKRNQKSRQVVEEGLEGPSCSNGTSLVMEEMKKVKLFLVQLYERLSFDGVTADTEFFNMLTAKWNDLSAVQSLSFTLCHLKFSKEQMLSLLTRTACRSLTLDFCHFEQDIISDKVINSMPCMQCLRIQPRSTVYLHQLTDATLKRWSVSPPTTIALYNCASNFTLQGIVEIIKSLAEDTLVDWDFGRILPRDGADGHLLSMMSISGMTIFVSDDFGSRRVQIARGPSRIAFNLIKEEAFTS
ncbi:F-box domain protein [Ancylostoma caninum]|uniref:F-box domain protein n=1 Tax=Ancylostoma caninum TaxID=29170 RepID=A0A368FPH2_ANCCA|nr:F-box domain protein [Ancylostoma caninum]